MIWMHVWSKDKVGVGLLAPTKISQMAKDGILQLADVSAGPGSYTEGR